MERREEVDNEPTIHNIRLTRHECASPPIFKSSQPHTSYQFTGSDWVSIMFSWRLSLIQSEDKTMLRTHDHTDLLHGRSSYSFKRIQASNVVRSYVGSSWAGL